MLPTFTIIAIAGPKTVGKTTVADALAEQIYKDSREMHAARASFAAPMRSMLRALGVPMEYYTTEKKEQPIDGLGVSIRDLMLSLGTDWGRGMVSENIWLWAMEQRLQKSREAASTHALDGEVGPHLIFVIDDCRFPNEAAWVNKQGGYVVQLTREGVRYTGEHATETPLPPGYIETTLDCGDVARCVDNIVKAIL